MEGPEMGGRETVPEPIDPPRLEPASSDEGPPRLRFWDIAYFFKCPVVGTCLSASEQRQLLKRVGISPKRRNDFEIHEILVSAAEKRGRLSEKMDRLLTRKFADDIASLADLDEGAFMARWEACFQSGQVAGPFWAAATRADLSIKSKRSIFGTIHMAMHENATSAATLRHHLAFEQEASRKMALKASEAARAKKTLQKEQLSLQQANTALSKQLAAVEDENQGLKQEMVSLKNSQIINAFEKENAALREEVKALSLRCVEKETYASTLVEETKRLSDELARHKDLSNHFQKEAHQLVRALLVHNRCDESCPSFDLCKRRVLIVGGLTKMEALYRQMVEDNGGIFEYHSGYMKNGTRNLERSLRRADIVLCPTSCNSHAACSMVKNLGKKHHKPVCILASSSLSAMAEALKGNGGVYACGN